MPSTRDTEDIPTDAELLSGPPEAFAELFDRHARALFRYCARRVGGHIAEDVVAETFLVAFERRHRYDTGRPDALPWLYGIATNLLHRHRHREARAHWAPLWIGVDRLGDVDTAEGPAQRAAERVDAEALADVIGRAMAALPRRQRDVLLLHALAGLPYGEIAVALGIPLGSVQSALFRARTRLRRFLPDHAMPSFRSHQARRDQP